jgi:hypothetical protein
MQGCAVVISATVLVAAGPFGERLSAERVAQAIGNGLLAGGNEPARSRAGDRPVTRRGEPAAKSTLAVDICPLDQELPVELPADFDTRMRSARAVAIAQRRLDPASLPGSPAFEIATRARQAGVPAYAIVREGSVDLFEARVLDLQVVLRATGTRELEHAGCALAELV